MFPTCDVELVRSMYSSSSFPSSTSAMRHSSPSLTLISISLDMNCKGRGARGKGQEKTQRPNARIFSRPWPLAPCPFLSKCLWDDLPRLVAQEVHHLSFRVKAHHLARHEARMFHGG